MEDLLPVAERGVLMPVGWNVLVPRVLGAALRCCGLYDSARRWLERSVERATLCGALPELARCWADLAALHALPHVDADRDEATRCVARAFSIARRHQLAPLERAVSGLGLSLGRFPGDAELLRAGEDDAVRPPLVGAILFTDIVDSTRRTRAVRDAAWVRVLGEHDRRLRACLARFGGTEFAYTGDGLAAYFWPRRMRCAALRRPTRPSHRSNRSTGRHCPCASASAGGGDPRGHDLAGSTISRTVRVMSVASAGQTVVDAEVRKATRQLWPWQPLGAPVLKGFEDERHEVYLLEAPNVP